MIQRAHSYNAWLSYAKYNCLLVPYRPCLLIFTTFTDKLACLSLLLHTGLGSQEQSELSLSSTKTSELGGGMGRHVGVHTLLY